MKKRFPGMDTESTKNDYEFTTPWLGSVMAKSHSMIQKVKQISEHQQANDLTTISIIGREGVGKSTLAILIAHMLHQELEKFSKKELTQTDQYLDKNILASRLGYIVKVLNRNDLMRFSEVLDELPKQNRIIIFDDISFIKGNISAVKQQVSEVRHDKDGIDKKTILIFNFHYTKGFDKYLRDTHFTIQASGGHEEFKNIGDLLGGGKVGSRISSTFIQKYTELSKHGKTCIRLSRQHDQKQSKITYYYSKPFRLALFYDGLSPRFMVYPSAGAQGSADPLKVQQCQICNPIKKTSVDIHSVNEWLVDRFGKAQVGIAMKNMGMIRYGHDVIHGQANVVLECIKRLESNGMISYVDLLEDYTNNKKQVIPYMRRGTTVPKDKRESFFLKFLYDGLKSKSDKTLNESDIQNTNIPN